MANPACPPPMTTASTCSDMCVLLWEMPLHAPILPATQAYVKQRFPLTGVDERSTEWPNAGAHLLPKADATQERTLEAVRCSALFGQARVTLLVLPTGTPAWGSQTRWH